MLTVVVVIAALAGIDVDVLVQVKFAGVMTEVKFAMSASLDRFNS